MRADFSLLLVVLTLITGLLWALDRYRWEPRRRLAAAGGEVPGPTGIVEFGRSLFPIVLAVFLVRSFVVEPFRIPSGSMVPTLLTGDFILVNKFAYGVRLPVFNIRMLPFGHPERGDVMVFRFPEDPSKDFIKRVIGLPGDEIVYRDKQVYVNGEPLPITPKGRYTGPGVPARWETWEFEEQVGSVMHRLLKTAGRPSYNMRAVVPPDHYFVMGDNRNNSDDSRRWGTVPDANLVGQAFAIWMNWDPDAKMPLWSRIGQGIH